MGEVGNSARRWRTTGATGGRAAGAAAVGARGRGAGRPGGARRGRLGGRVAPGRAAGPPPRRGGARGDPGAAGRAAPAGRRRPRRRRLLDRGARHPLPPRSSGTATWTGRELVVWGGAADDGAGTTAFLADGAALDPLTGTWRALAAAPLSPRQAHVAVWTGTDLLVWGGEGPDGLLADGAAWNPATDRWRALPPAPLAPRADAAAAWTGTELLVAGGRGPTRRSLTPRRWTRRPAAGARWRPCPPRSSPPTPPRWRCPARGGRTGRRGRGRLACRARRRRCGGGRVGPRHRRLGAAAGARGGRRRAPDPGRRGRRAAARPAHHGGRDRGGGGDARAGCGRLDRG